MNRASSGVNPIQFITRQGAPVVSLTRNNRPKNDRIRPSRRKQTQARIGGDGNVEKKGLYNQYQNPFQPMIIPFPMPMPVMTPQGPSAPNSEQALLQVLNKLANSLSTSNIQVGQSFQNLNPTMRNQNDKMPVSVGVQFSPAVSQATQVGVPTGFNTGVEVQTDLNVPPMDTQTLTQFGESRQLNASMPKGAVEQESQATNTQRKDGRALPVAGRDQQSMRIAPQGSVNVPSTSFARNEIGMVMENILGQVQGRATAPVRIVERGPSAEALGEVFFRAITDVEDVERLKETTLSPKDSPSQRRAKLMRMIQNEEKIGLPSIKSLASQAGITEGPMSRQITSIRKELGKPKPKGKGKAKAK